jgi:DNA-binding transcriptional regulator YiaG
MVQLKTPPFSEAVQDYIPAQIKGIRLRFKASQAVFAAYLNTSPSTIQQWKRGQKHPNGLALKLLSLVDSKGLQALAYRGTQIFEIFEYLRLTAKPTIPSTTTKTL